MSKQLTQMVKKIQFEKELTIDQVAKSINYSRVHLQREMKKEGSSPVIDILRNKYKEVLQNVTPESKSDTEKEEVGQTMTMQMLADVIKGNLELIENNKVLTRINEKHTNMLDDKLPPVNFDLIALVETVRQLDAKVNLLLRSHIEQAEEDLRKEAGQFVDDRDKEARAIADRLRQSGKHGFGKTHKK